MTMSEAHSGGTATEVEETTPDTGEPLGDEETGRATGLAIAAAGAAVVGFVSFFRLRAGWDHSRARVLRRVLGVQVESVAGVVLGSLALNRLRNTPSDRRGVPFAVAGVVLGVSTLVRVFRWLRSA